MSAKHTQNAMARPVKTFLETTSVKGVPRIMKSGRPVLRLLWALAVAIGAVVALYFLTKLFIGYFSYSVTMSVEEERIQHLEFPSVTLCNLNPLANTDVTPVQIKAYFDSVSEVLGTTLTVEQRLMYSRLLHASTVFENLASNSSSLKPFDFITSCRWYGEVVQNDSFCKDNSERRIFSTDAGNCFTFEPPANVGYTTGFSAVLYIDDSLEVNIPYYELNIARPFAAGALVTVHPQGSLPDISDATILPVGKDTHVFLKLSRRQKLGLPFSTCKDVPFVAEEYTYTRPSCQQLCYQALIQAECGCTHGLLPSLEETRNASAFCGMLDDQLSMMDNALAYDIRSKCVETVSQDTALCDAECPMPCLEERYAMTSQSIDWPHTAYQLSFWNTYVRNQVYAQRFQVYEELFSQQESQPDETYDRLQAETDLHENYLQVHVAYWTDLVTDLEDKEALTIEGLIGAMGGTLNLWIGISFVTLIELIDMLLNICTGCKKDATVQAKSDSPVA